MAEATRVLVVCGIPGSGKSVFAQHLASNCRSIIFESDHYLSQLYSRRELGLDASGDFTAEALDNVYLAMAAGVRSALAGGVQGLVLVVGTFRRPEQRSMIREIAAEHSTACITVMIVCELDVARQRVAARREAGGHGPTGEGLEAIAHALNDTPDVDMQIYNRGSLADYLDHCMKCCEQLVVAVEAAEPDMQLLNRFNVRAEETFHSVASDIASARLEAWPSDRIYELVTKDMPDSASVYLTSLPGRRVRLGCASADVASIRRRLESGGVRVVSEEVSGLELMLPAITPSNRLRISELISDSMTCGRDELRGLRNRSWLACGVERGDRFEGDLQRAADKWINAIDQVGGLALADLDV